MALRPLNDCVLIEPEPDPTYAEQIGLTHIVVPDRDKWGPTDPPKWGKIVAFGDTCTRHELAEGDRVLYAKFGWAKVPLGEGKHMALVRECDLIAVDE